MDDSDQYAPDPEAPPRNEQEYLAHRIKELERANRRWKRNILLAVAAALLFLLFTGSFLMFRARVQQARIQAVLEQLEAEQRQELQQLEAGKRQQLEAAKQKERGR
jgi:hypothetical protein